MHTSDMDTNVNNIGKRANVTVSYQKGHRILPVKLLCTYRIMLYCVQLLIMTSVLFSCNRKETSLEKYLENIEIQYETQSQKAVILEVLNDMLKITPEMLKQKKYPNYTGEKDQWDCRIVLDRYFVPDDPSKTLSDDFYNEITTRTVQKRILLLISDLEMKQ